MLDEVTLRAQALLERVRQNLWFWPLLTAVASVVLATLLGEVDVSDGSLLDTITVSMPPDTVRSVLATLLGALVTASSVVSSLTIVALQTASTQFSPRLLRDFLRDGTTQWVLALFVGTSGFLSALILEADADTARLAVTIALVLVLTSVIVIAIFFNHVSQSIRVESIMHRVVEESQGAVTRLDRWVRGGAARPATSAQPPPGAHDAHARHTGYVQQIGVGGLRDLAERHDVVVEVLVQLGQPATRGAPIARWWPRDGSSGGGVGDGVEPVRSVDRLGRAIVGQIEIGGERTMHHDVGFAMRQLVDMSIKAMSPAVNDPYTAAQAVDHLGSILVSLGDVPLGDRAWRDDADVDRVLVPVATFAELAGLASDQLRRYGAREPAVLDRLMKMLRDVAASVDARHEPELRALVVLVAESSSMEASVDRRHVEIVRDEILGWFDHRTPLRQAARGGL